jgi:hypothetical protein
MSTSDEATDRGDEAPRAARPSREPGSGQSGERQERPGETSANGEPEAQAQAVQPDEIGDELTPVEQGQ